VRAVVDWSFKGVIDREESLGVNWFRLFILIGVDDWGRAQRGKLVKMVIIYFNKKEIHVNLHDENGSKRCESF